MNTVSVRLFKTKESVQFASDDMSFESTEASSSYLDMDPFDVFERASRVGSVVLAGICVSILFSIICISFGIYIALYKQAVEDVVLSPSWRNTSFDAVRAVFTGVVVFLPTINSAKTEVLSLTLNLVVTMCTESIGFVHSVALKSALARESRLDSNTNLRLLTAARGSSWVNPNGTIFNMIMATLLIISYVSSSLVFIPFQAEVVDVSLQQWWNTSIFAAPVLVLGIALLLQAIIAIAGICQTKMLTWSSSPLDTAAALLHVGQLTHRPGLCMHSVVDSTSYLGPLRPSELQPSAWQSHPSIKKIIIVLWCLVFACAMWGVVVVVVTTTVLSAGNRGLNSLSILPNSRTRLIGYDTYVNPDLGYPAASWIVMFIVFIVIQGSLTVGLHCSEVIANVVRDEVLWRKATTRSGTKPSNNPLLTVMGSWPNIGLLIAKPILHWMFGLSLDAEGFTNPLGKSLLRLSVNMRPVQIWYLTLGLLVFALASTIIARRRPRGPQPAAYGHLQTLANLVDEWSPTMWWGHKKDGKPIGHAGTSQWPLPPIRMNTWYAGM